LSYLRTLPSPSAYNISKVQFLQACLKQLFLIDRATGYKLAFVYVRQLAVALRTLLSGRTRSALKKVTSHKFIAAAELLGEVVPSYPELVYPLAQVVIGTFRTVIHVRFAPLRLRLLHILTSLTEESGVEVPIAGLVLEVTLVEMLMSCRLMY
jgi:nucleolar complex protein 2